MQMVSNHHGYVYMITKSLNEILHSLNKTKRKRRLHAFLFPTQIFKGLGSCEKHADGTLLILSFAFPSLHSGSKQEIQVKPWKCADLKVPSKAKPGNMASKMFTNPIEVILSASPFNTPIFCLCRMPCFPSGSFTSLRLR